MNKRRIISIICALAMCFGTFSIVACKEDTPGNNHGGSIGGGSNDDDEDIIIVPKPESKFKSKFQDVLDAMAEQDNTKFTVSGKDTEVYSNGSNEQAIDINFEGALDTTHGNFDGSYTINESSRYLFARDWDIFAGVTDAETPAEATYANIINVKVFLQNVIDRAISEIEKSEYAQNIDFSTLNITAESILSNVVGVTFGNANVLAYSEYIGAATISEDKTTITLDANKLVYDVAQNVRTFLYEKVKVNSTVEDLLNDDGLRDFGYFAMKNVTRTEMTLIFTQLIQMINGYLGNEQIPNIELIEMVLKVLSITPDKGNDNVYDYFVKMLLSDEFKEIIDSLLANSSADTSILDKGLANVTVEDILILSGIATNDPIVQKTENKPAPAMALAGLKLQYSKLIENIKTDSFSITQDFSDDPNSSIDSSTLTVWDTSVVYTIAEDKTIASYQLILNVKTDSTIVPDVGDPVTTTQGHLIDATLTVADGSYVYSDVSNYVVINR